MRFLFAHLCLLLASAAIGAAQNSSSPALPSCAATCLTGAIKASSCAVTDRKCQCTDPVFVKSAETCVVLSCSVVDSLAAKNFTQTSCGAPVRDKSIQYNVVSCTLMILAAVVVMTRVGYKKFFTSNDLGLDDWFIILTLVVCVPSAVMNLQLTRYGLGRDIWTLSPDTITNFALTFYIVAILYFAEVFVLKLAMLFFYLRIFPSKGMKRLLWGTVAFDVLFGLAFIFAATFQCTPISYNWTNWKREGGGQCVNISVIAWANASISIAIDVWMLALPLSQLPGLNLHWKKKIGVAMMFFVGTFVTVISSVRLSSLVEFRASTNLTWDYWGVSIWSTVEITIGVVCACMPSLRLIMVRIFPKIFDATSAASKSLYYQRKGNSTSRSTTNQGSRNRSSWKPSTQGSWPSSRATQDKFKGGIQLSQLHSVTRSELNSHNDETELVPAYKIEISSTGNSMNNIYARDANLDGPGQMPRRPGYF